MRLRSSRLASSARGYKPFSSQFPEALLELDFQRQYFRLGSNVTNNFLQIPGASVTGGAGFATAVNSRGQVIGPFAPNTLPATDAGVEVWEARTNLFQRSQAFGSSWTVAIATVTDNAVAAPDGTLTGARIVADSTAVNTGLISQGPAGSGAFGTYTSSVYCKKGTSSGIRLQPNSTIDSVISGAVADLNLTTLAVSSSTYGGKFAIVSTRVDQLAGGWVRFSVTYTTSGTTPPNSVQQRIYPYIPGDAAGVDAYLWGAQLEAGSFPSPYISTTTAAATRTALRVSIPRPTFVDEGTAWVEVMWASAQNAIYLEPATAGWVGAFSLSQASFNAPRNQYRHGTNRFDSVGNAASISVGDVARLAISWDATGALASNQGVAPAPGTTPPQVDWSTEDVFIGSRVGSTQFANTKIRRVLWFPRKFSQTELNALTAV